MTTRKTTTYNSNNITTHVGLDAVRGSPAMYIGGTDEGGLFLILRELLDNALDEALAGRNNFVGVAVLPDGSYMVQDCGEGIPQGIKSINMVVSGKPVVNKIPTMQAIFGELHTSGKYTSDAYKVSIGSHGVGAKGTNATSAFFKVWTSYNGAHYHVAFEKGKLVTPVRKCQAPRTPPFGPLKRGTLIHFKPDPTIFKAKSFPSSMLEDWASVKAYLTPGFKIVAKAPNGKERTWFSKKGPIDYIADRLTALKGKLLTDEAPIFQYRTDLAHVVIAFTNLEGADVRGFTSGLNNPDGGVHLDAVFSALYSGIEPLRPKRGAQFKMADFKDGMLGLINVNLHKAEFTGQNKSKLSDSRIGKEFVAELTQAASQFFRKHRQFALMLVEKATQFAKLKSQFKLSASTVRELNKIKRQGMPLKYASYDPKTPLAKRELFLIEGDSAAGPLKSHKFSYQAALPLKGKVVNALNDPKNKATSSAEIINIFGAIGFDPKAQNPYDKLLVNRIIVLADPDPDGPFVANTLVNVFNHSTSTYEPKSISDMIHGGQFTTTALVDGRVKNCLATANMVKVASHLVRVVFMDCEGSTHSYTTDFKHLWPVEIDAGDDRPSVVRNSLNFRRAGDLRLGDRVISINGTVSIVSTSHVFSSEVPLYCLTVPEAGNFILPSGIVSANCHIETLLLSLLYKYLPELFDRGMVYVAKTHEFYAVYSGKVYMGDSLSAVRAKLDRAKAPEKHPMHHIKGWGEISGDLLRIMALDPESRNLIQIKPGTNPELIEQIMGKDATYRKRMLGIDVGGTEE